jgi:hypothetical protein
MNVDVEEMLSRELHQVADDLQVPPPPPLPRSSPTQPTGVRRHWRPLLVAAAMVLVAGVLALLASHPGGDRGPQPAPTPTPTAPTQTTADIPTDPPKVPYLVNQQLYFDGQQVPGTWWQVDHGDAAWIAASEGYASWSFGRGARPETIEKLVSGLAPVISPNGKYVGTISTSSGQSTISGFTTDFAGEGFGGHPIDLGDEDAGDPVQVRAVTDDGMVIVQGRDTSLLWLPLTTDSSTVDLSETAPGQLVVGNSPVGLIVTDGEDGPAYLATISATGEITKVAELPSKDALVDPSGTWVAWPGADLGGEVTEIPALRAQTIDGNQPVTLKAPRGWAFKVGTWTWEDDDYLVSTVVRGNQERMARCSPAAGACMLIWTGFE